MAELENRKQFAQLLAPGVKTLKLHPDYKVRRKKNEKTGQSYIDKIALQLGVSPNTIKSWIGQMGANYIPGRIDDGKLFGMIWIILEKTDFDIDWLTNLLETTTRCNSCSSFSRLRGRLQLYLLELPAGTELRSNEKRMAKHLKGHPMGK